MNTVYFLNAGFGQSLTGIEHASIKRFELLLKNNINVKIVTLNYSANYSHIFKNLEIPENRFLNFFRFFQNFTEESNNDFESYKKKFPSIKFYFENKTCIKGFIDNILVMKIKLFSINYKVYKIQHIGSDLNVYKEQIYDISGYISSEKYFIDKFTNIQRYYNSSGSVFLEIIVFSLKKKYILHQDKRKIIFSCENKMYAYWFDMFINRGDILIIDKNRLYNPIVVHIGENDIKKISIIHSTHTINPNANNNKININYKFLLENQGFFDACVVSTDEQYNDLTQDFSMQIPVYVIPSGFVINQKLNTKKIYSNRFRILSIGRISVEKRHEDMISAMKIVRASIPQAQLEFFGMGNIELKKQLQHKIKQEKLDDCIFFRNYSHDIQSELYNSDLTLVASTVEGFCIAIIDSLEQGTPVIAYDIKYGPSSIIKNGINGTLVENGNVDKLAQAIIDFYFKNKLTYTQNTALIMENYSFNKVANLWINFLNKLNSEFLDDREQLV